MDELAEAEQLFRKALLRHPEPDYLDDNDVDSHVRRLASNSARIEPDASMSMWEGSQTAGSRYVRLAPQAGRPGVENGS
jgi:hypothetical protein